MSTAAQIQYEAERSSSAAARVRAAIENYLQLMKLRVTALVVATAWCGYFMGAMKSGASSFSWQLVHSLLGIGMVAGGAAALNQVLERDADARMLRTQHRPLPAGRMAAAHAVVFGILLLLGGATYLAFTTNLLTGYLSLSTAAAYLLFYTPLKQLTPFCTFVGAFPGAMPALLGWTAIRGRVEWEALALFAIMLLWQFPHFLAIAWLYAEDYKSGGIRMLPVVERDGRSTTREILLYSATLIPVSMAPAILGMTGWAYAAGAAVLSAIYFCYGVRLRRLHLAPTAAHSKPAARQLLKASVLYLPVLFALMMANAKWRL
jgi:protoheme IX farnesyltransferase